MNYIKRTEYGITINGNQDIKNSLIMYINRLCLEDGSTYQGRLEYSKHILNNHKNPIYINDDCVLMPTHSTRKYECTFINFFMITNIKECNSKTQIVFQNGTSVLVPVSMKILKNQMKRTTFLIQTIQKRKCLQTGIINRFYI